MTLFFDGGCRPNPGPIEVAVVTGGKRHVRRDLGDGDSGVAEWQALLYAVEIAVAAQAQDVLLIGDARAIVEQAAGRWKCHSAAMRPYLATFRAATAGIAKVQVRYVPRTKNLAGIVLDKG